MRDKLGLTDHQAAEILGLNRNTLRKKIQDLGVEMSRGRR